MRRASIFSLVCVIAGVAGATASATSQPLVPTFIQAAIAVRSPQLAYVPSRIAPGFKYERYAASPQAVRVTFKNKAGWQLVFIATPLVGSCRAGMEKSFQLAGNKVFWMQTPSEQRAWRCVSSRNGHVIRLVTATNQPPTRFADVGLGVVTASAHRVALRET
jgi:hypothetical protein